MKHSLTYIGILALCASSLMSQAQSFQNLTDITPSSDFENVEVKKLNEDDLASTFVIWVKTSVKAHYHATHTEVVHVLEGTGLMTLGNEERKIGPGDYVFIPKGTPHSVQVIGSTPMKVLSMQTPRFDGTDRVFVDQ